MHISYALLADAATSGGGGKLNIIGTFNSLGAPQFPVQHNRMYLVVRIEGHVTESGQHTAEVDFVNADGQSLPDEPQRVPFQLQQRMPGTPLTHTLVLEINSLVLPEPGDYEFAIKVDGKYLDRVPLYVRKVEPPNQPSG